MTHIKLIKSLVEGLVNGIELFLKLNTNKKIIYTILLSFSLLIFCIFNLISFQSLKVSANETHGTAAMGSGFMNRDIYDIGGQISDGFIQFSIQLIKLESYFLDNYAGVIPNPQSDQFSDKNRESFNLNTKNLMDFSVKLALSTLVLISTLQGCLLIFSADIARVGRLIKLMLVACALIIASPLIIKYLVNIFNSLNEAIISNFYDTSTSGKSLSESLIYSMGIRAQDPSPNYINYIGLSIALIVNCFALGINFFILLFLSVLFPLVLSVLPLEGGSSFVNSFMHKLFSCLLVWPCWLIGLSIVIGIINSSKNIDSTTILGLIGIFSISTIPSLVSSTLSSPRINALSIIRNVIGKIHFEGSHGIKYANKRVILNNSNKLDHAQDI